MIWETWKKGFDAWENATAKYLEVVLSSPLVLEPAGRMLTMVARAKVAQDDFFSNAWHAVGLPSRRDQERLMHAVNQLNSRVLDAEEDLAEQKPKSRRSK